ncbi:MAG: 4Fe-4S binding protein [Clostridiaceae bacterium]|nr:4Fe-4S binding protein [Clostridiaceae bacterium]
MIRNIVKIDEEKCNGCGLCVSACMEGALQIVDGKAKLISESYCDGLGACLPECPTGAITIEKREAEEFDEEAVKKHIKVSNQPAFICPSMAAKTFDRDKEKRDEKNIGFEPVSQLRQWPIQIKLVNPHAPFFNNAHLLIAADCCAYAYANIHDKFMKNKITLIGCPKLDEVDYSEKLAEILKHNDIKSVTVLRMEVPCCSQIANAVKTALINSGKMIPWSVQIISTDGELIDD